MGERRTISVRGSAKVKGTPDWVVITFDIQSRNYDYEKCTEMLAEQTDSLKKELSAVGITKENLKTYHFDINTDFDWVKGKRIFKGYNASHKLKVEFPFDKDYMNRVMQVLSRTKSNATFCISFEIADPEPLRQRAITEAVKNATEKAMVLAEAAGVKLGDIVQIDYTWSEIHIRSTLEIREMAAQTAAPDYDLTPEDVDIEESVSVIWLIK